MLWFTAAWGAPVVCNPTDAARILRDARIDEARAPVTHPQLVPGLARAANPQAELQQALTELCSPGGELTVDRAHAWRNGRGSAYVVVATRASVRGCSVVQSRVAISVGIGRGPARYTLLDRPPAELTPLPGCDAQPTWRQSRTLEGQGSPVRVILEVDRRGDERLDSAVAVLWASEEGWQRQVLARPAPARYLVQHGAGPRFRVGTSPTGEVLVVASGSRSAPPCRPRGGQKVWTLEADGWRSHTGRDALTHLAEEGLTELAGDPGYLLILTQDDEADANLVDARMRRLQRQDAKQLYLFESASFPLLNPGYVLVAPGPWPTREAAEAARRPRQRGAYVKQAWNAVNGCSDRD